MYQISLCIVIICMIHSLVRIQAVQTMIFMVLMALSIGPSLLDLGGTI